MASTRTDLSDALWVKSSYSNGSGGNCVEVARHFPGAARWRKSEHSNSDGGECVEVGYDFPGAARWRKSSHSNGDGGHCVEVAEGIPGIVPVRDSKDPAGPVIVVADTTWSAFITGVRRS